jgi:hypothetical protein
MPPGSIGELLERFDALLVDRNQMREGGVERQRSQL